MFDQYSEQAKKLLEHQYRLTAIAARLREDAAKIEKLQERLEELEIRVFQRVEFDD